MNVKDFKLSTVGEDDYPELEGKIIDWVSSSGSVEKGVVVGCNLSVGITIVRVDDKDHYLCCLTGPVAPGECSYNEINEPEEMLSVLIEMIQKGVVHVSRIIEYVKDYNKVVDTRGTGASSERCAYRQ